MTSTFQERVLPWMLETFGETVSNDQLERADRFLEEALELCQTVEGFGPERVAALVSYVFNRPIGHAPQEVGGVMVTLAALCLANQMDMHLEGELELRRVWTKVEEIRAKQAAKPKGSALPTSEGAMTLTDNAASFASYGADVIVIATEVANRGGDHESRELIQAEANNFADKMLTGMDGEDLIAAKAGLASGAQALLGIWHEMGGGEADDSEPVDNVIKLRPS